MAACGRHGMLRQQKILMNFSKCHDCANQYGAWMGRWDVAVCSWRPGEYMLFYCMGAVPNQQLNGGTLASGAVHLAGGVT